ncbi:hypothetical protein PDTK01_17930 [Phycicoccus sp. DTK01]|nr:hypothetical protein PDTK01_17930 [Phycicoccus sp. DTK01]
MPAVPAVGTARAAARVPAAARRVNVLVIEVIVVLRRGRPRVGDARWSGRYSPPAPDGRYRAPGMPGGRFGRAATGR